MNDPGKSRAKVGRTTRVALRPLRKLSIVDVITALLLCVAVFLLIRPTSSVNRKALRWWRLESASRQTRSDWEELAAIAAPLSAASQPPELIEVLDYECPFCRAITATVDSAMDVGIRVAVLHMPLRIHELASSAALVALCAEQIGMFPETHHYLMQTSEWRTDTTKLVPPAIANPQTALDFAKCRDSDETAAILNKHKALTDSLGLLGTPMFLTPRGVLKGPPSFEKLRRFARPS